MVISNHASAALQWKHQVEQKEIQDVQFGEKTIVTPKIYAERDKEIGARPGIIGKASSWQNPIQLSIQLVKGKSPRNGGPLKSQQVESWGKCDAESGFTPSRQPTLAVLSSRHRLQTHGEHTSKGIGEPFSTVKGSSWSQEIWARSVLAWGPWESKRPWEVIVWSYKVNPGLYRDTSVLEVPEPQDICQGELRVGIERAWEWEVSFRQWSGKGRAV